MAGGLQPFAYVKDSELTRVTPTENGPQTVKIHIDLEKALQGDLANDIVLKEDDYLFVRSIPEWELYRTVEIKGYSRNTSMSL
jgi:hypothetical protein